MSAIDPPSRFRWVARWVALGAAVAALAGAGSVLFGAELWPTTSSSIETCPAEDDDPRPAEGLHASTVVSLELGSSGESACVVVEAIQSVPGATVTLHRYADGVDTVSAEAAIPALEEGERAARELAAGGTFVGDVGLTASVSVGDEGIGSMFLAVRSTEHGLVTAPSLGLLDDAELSADLEAGRLTEAEYQVKLHELHQVGGEWTETTPP